MTANFVKVVSNSIKYVNLVDILFYSYGYFLETHMLLIAYPGIFPHLIGAIAIMGSFSKSQVVCIHLPLFD